MPSDDPSRPRRPGPFGRLWRRNPEAEPADEGGDLVDQAEAFKSLRVTDLMTPRADIVAVEVDTPFSEVLARFVEAEHSRMPIYRETLDEPAGVVHVKDVFKVLAGSELTPAPDEAILGRLKRELLYVPPSMPAAALLAKMQTTRSHMAMVIDEFGGVDGLITLEDLLEAVVGEIDDEHDDAVGPQVLTRADGTYEADARAPLEDLEELVGETLTPEDLDDDIDTVAGLVVALAGRVPQRGEVISHPAGYDVEVLDADPRRVRRVRLHRIERSGDETDSEA